MSAQPQASQSAAPRLHRLARASQGWGIARVVSVYRPLFDTEGIGAASCRFEATRQCTVSQTHAHTGAALPDAPHVDPRAPGRSNSSRDPDLWGLHLQTSPLAPLRMHWRRRDYTSRCVRGDGAHSALNSARALLAGGAFPRLSPPVDKKNSRRRVLLLYLKGNSTPCTLSFAPPTIVENGRVGQTRGDC